MEMGFSAGNSAVIQQAINDVKSQLAGLEAIWLSVKEKGNGKESRHDKHEDKINPQRNKGSSKQSGDKAIAKGRKGRR